MRKSIALLAIPALALGLTACRGQSPAAGGEQPTTIKIMVGGLDKVIYLPAKLTEQLGYFKDAGVDVQLLSEPSGAQAENVMLAGEVDGVVGFYDHTVDLQAKGKCVESVVQFADVPGEAEVVASGKAGTITSAKDFAGKKLGVTSPGSSTDMITRALAVRNGVEPSKYTTVKAGAGQTFIAAIDNGGIDAGMTTDPTIAKLTSSGKAKVFIEMRTQEGTRAALGGLYPGASLYMPCDFVAKHKETIQKMVNAFVKTLTFIDTHTAAEIAAKMPADYAGSDPKLYEQSINDSKGMFTADGVMPADGPQTVLEVLKPSNEAVKAKADQIDLTKTYTTEFVKAAS
ncbi:ABC transporter substrate-binding protein [Micromonospora narathiwatensis]|uniref:NitT/TauT family transport system substrate-binding protein n=1 Tax=Micromonospora narathiwatensis TaxID=299146 RepID=A0A1A8ZR18_9ACTN|nr:ABC transporter substrate-binding protein [Micromonospora narathiwatensis]SBT46305.1 NitT/TauT family transport system substrate-binding protein [Micromonospora narathiwatensis]